MCRARAYASASASARSNSTSRPSAAGGRRLAAKLAVLALLKPDDLAILFDDMRGDVPDLAERQAAIVHYAAERGIADRIFCCPSYYSDDPILDVAFGARPSFYLEQIGRLLDPAIRIFWTGEEVCSREYTLGHLAALPGRSAQAGIWDNYPVNDGARMSQHLHLRGFTGRPGSIAGPVAAHGINPASQPLLSRIPALTLAKAMPRATPTNIAPPSTAPRGRCSATSWPKGSPRPLTLQDRGLDRLAERRAVLRTRYAAFDHPAAREILAWLDGQRNVTDEMVQTQ